MKERRPLRVRWYIRRSLITKDVDTTHVDILTTCASRGSAGASRKYGDAEVIVMITVHEQGQVRIWLDDVNF
jgi:hypothetical protein